MGFEAVATTFRVLGFAVAEGLRGVWGSVRRGPVARWRWPGPAPDYLILAPQDVRTNDPTLAIDYYIGIFSFAGKTVETMGRSVFEIEPPSDAWARALHGFSWLRHLRAAETAIARENARAQVSDWIAMEKRLGRLAQEPEVVARRVMSWVSHSPLILEKADHRFYTDFVRALARQVKRLHYLAHDIPDGYPRLLGAIAVAAAAVSMHGQSKLLRQASLRLDQELNRQILADGGHISRHPGVLLEILADLLPLVRAYSAQGVSPPPGTLKAIDRMMPMLRFFRHRDGSLALFNGMGVTPHDLLATVLAYDDIKGQPVRNAVSSGYQRLEAGASVVLMETGRAPPMTFSGKAHAGTLAFELSVGGSRVVTNCGTIETDERWAQVSRSTAAHATVTVEDTNSVQFLANSFGRRLLGPVVIDGPRFVSVERQETETEIRVVARHDGYDDRFGLLHERTLSLSGDGDVLIGRDRLIWSSDPAESHDRYAVRFHLHPNVSAELGEDGRVTMTLQDGAIWAFDCTQLVPELTDSIYLCDTYGRRKTSQIVLSSAVHTHSRVDWWFQRLA